MMELKKTKLRHKKKRKECPCVEFGGAEDGGEDIGVTVIPWAVLT